MRLIVMSTPGFLVLLAYTGYTIESRSLQARGKYCKSDKLRDRGRVWIWEFADGRPSSAHRVRDWARPARARSPKRASRSSSTDATARCSIRRPRKFAKALAPRR